MDDPMARTAAPARSSGKDTLRNEITDLKRERILGEAVELFYRKGYLPTTVDAVAERLGATKPFVYYHFKSKIDLLVEICQRATREALGVTARVVAEPGPPRERLERLVREFTMVVLENHQHVSIYFREELNLPGRGAQDRPDAQGDRPASARPSEGRPARGRLRVRGCGGRRADRRRHDRATPLRGIARPCR